METISRSLSEICLRLKVSVFGSRASDKPITCAGDNQYPSWAHEVMSDDDLLTEILLRLPIISTLQFKSVSKRWLSLITDPSFTLLWSKIHDVYTPSGLFIQKPPPSSSVRSVSFDYDYVPLEIRISPKLITAFTFGSQGNIEILQSCNGLLLCHVHPEEYWVYNPSINQFKRIPQLPFWGSNHGMRLVFDPAKSPQYTVMCAGLINLYSYSSKAHSWSDCGAQFSFESRPNFSVGIYCNDAIHWLSVSGALLYKLDVERLLVTSIPTPLSFDAESHPLDYKLFASGDSLFFVCIVQRLEFIYSRYLEVYKMRNGYSEWSLKYEVSLESIARKFTKTWKVFSKWLDSDLLAIVAGEREEDSFLVMRLSGKVVKYMFVSKTLHVLSCFGSVPRSSSIEPASCFPFIGSFAAV